MTKSKEDLILEQDSKPKKDAERIESLEKREFSAIDSIYEILDQIVLMNKSIRLLDNNIKILHNKISKMEEKPARTIKAVIPIDEDKCKLFGKVVGRGESPLFGVAVNIYRDAIKFLTTDTDISGEWSLMVPAGKYIVEYKIAGFKPAQKEVEIAPNTKTFMVK